MKSRRIEICGGIGVGKSTLAEMLGRELPHNKVVFENYSENPIWRLFYRNPEIFEREKNISFLAQHVAEIKSVGKEAAIFDFCLLQDLAYAKISGIHDHYEVMVEVYRHLSRDIGEPCLIVHVKAAMDRQLSQIRNRGREEELNLQKNFLLDLNVMTEQLIHQLADDCSLVISVNSEDVYEGSPVIREIVRSYMATLE
jgi:deoxyadenosine/deoxycytidine kinase